MMALVCIGNSDDKLSQQEWVAFQLDVKLAMRYEADAHIHGEWHSYPDSIYQNAAWCIDIEDDDKMWELKGKLAAIAQIYRQDAITWNELTGTVFLGQTKIKDAP